MREFEKNLEKEYEDFKEKMLTKNKEEIYNSFYKIRFFENMHDFLSVLEELETVFDLETAIEVLSKNTLEELYDDFIDMEEVSISGYSKIIEFLELVAENM